MASQTLARESLRFQHHVARYCRPRWVVNGIVSRDAFLLREGEPFLSTNWLEYFHHSDRGVQISGVRAALAGKNFNIHPNGGFTVLNVGVATYLVWHFQRIPLEFRTLGQPGDLSHTGIFGYGHSNIDPKSNDVAQSLAASVLEMHSAIP